MQLIYNAWFLVALGATGVVSSVLLVKNIVTLRRQMLLEMGYTKHDKRYRRPFNLPGFVKNKL